MREKQDILTFTIFAELSHDLQFESDVVWGYRDGPPWAGWTEESMAEFVGLEEPVERGVCPDCRLFFRDAPSLAVKSSQIVEDVFANWIEQYRSQSEQAAQTAAGAGINRMSTVAAVSMYVPGGRLPTQDGQLETHLATSLQVLSDYLTSLGMGGNDALLGPLATTDLPPGVPSQPPLLVLVARGARRRAAR